MLKHKAETEPDQDPFVRWLAQWYTNPQGSRVRERLRERIRRHGVMATGDIAVELAPVPLLEEPDQPRAKVIRMTSAEPALYAAPEAWPFDAECARRIVLAHPCAYAADPDAVVAEAVRVLEPEGLLFLLEGNRLKPGPRGAVRVSSLPEGLRRRQYRQWLEAADLEVDEQWSLSLLPPGLPANWQRRLATVDAWTLRGLPPLASVVLTVARRRVGLPLRPEPLSRFVMPAARSPGALAPSRVFRHTRPAERTRTHG